MVLQPTHSSALVFEAENIARRVHAFPDRWRELSDEAHLSVDVATRADTFAHEAMPITKMNDSTSSIAAAATAYDDLGHGNLAVETPISPPAFMTAARTNIDYLNAVSDIALRLARAAPRRGVGRLTHNREQNAPRLKDSRV